MAINLMDGGDTEEDEAVAHVVKVNPNNVVVPLLAKASKSNVTGANVTINKVTVRLAYTSLLFTSPADNRFQSRLLFNFNNLVAMTSLSLILTCWTISMSTAVSKMRMTGSTISTS